MKRAAGKRKKRGSAASASKPSAFGSIFGLLPLLVVGAQVFPVIMTRLANDENVTGAFLAPLACWLGIYLLALWWSRPSCFAGDRLFVWLTMTLLGLGIGEQMRLGTWVETWTIYQAYAPLLLGAGSFLFALRFLSAERVEALLGRLYWVLWLGALATLAVLLVFGRSYRGGLFLPGQVNPTELVKLFLVAFSAVWIPKHAQELSRTLCGFPFPPLRTALALGAVWGIPLLGVIAVRDLGLVLILCLTLMLMLAFATRRAGWLVAGVALAGIAGWAVRFVSAHAARRFAVWLDPFRDPTGSGWQIGQSLCAQFAGGLWGTGIGEGTPGAVPIVTSDFIYAAIAEEWGLVGCLVLLGLYWLWIGRMARAGAPASASRCTPGALLGVGVASWLGVQIVLNIGGVTKALPMTGITLPLLSQGGFSLLVVLASCGLLSALGKRTA